MQTTSHYQVKGLSSLVPLQIHSIAYSQLMMCKLRRRHFNKLEAMKARHHIKDAMNITLPKLKLSRHKCHFNKLEVVQARKECEM